MRFEGDTLSVPKGADTLLRDVVHERTGLYYDDGRLAQMLGRASQEHSLRRAEPPNIMGRTQRGRQSNPRQEDRVPVMLIDVGDHLGLAGPKLYRVAIGGTEGTERGPPGSSAHDGKLHGTGPALGD